MLQPTPGRAAAAGAAPLFVTRPALPPLAELLPLLEEIWASRQLTNGGPVQQRFETQLAEYLGVPALTVVTNATLGLVLALQKVGAACGEVITTPFSFVATGHAVLWAGATPVFADVRPDHLGLDPDAVRAAITPRTRAILAVHCYGYACDVDGLEQVARSHGLPLVYDAAHAFGVRYRGKSLLDYGDHSVLSFHATKVYQTFEGGAITTRTPEDKRALERLANYGIVDETFVESLGLNAKASEFQAALGLVQLRHVGAYMEQRGARDRRYRELLRDVPGIEPMCPPAGQEHNHYNFPVRVQDEFGPDRDLLHAHLKSKGIYARRYFYPLLGEFPMYRGFPSGDPDSTPVARDAARRVLCLPLYPDLSEEDQERVIAELHAARAHRVT